MHLNDRIKQDRTKLSLTQDEYAKLIDITRGTLSRLELGNYNPSPKTLRKLKDHFKLSIEELLGSETVNDLAGGETTRKLMIKYIQDGQIKRNFMTPEASNMLLKSLQLEANLIIKINDKEKEN